MPEISRFYGIVIQIYYGDHVPSHFHVTYSGQKAVIDIESLALIEGALPPRAIGLVIEWATIHRDELRQAFKRCRWSSLTRSIPFLSHRILQSA